jgi:hypothetical protein
MPTLIPKHPIIFPFGNILKNMTFVKTLIKIVHLLRDIPQITKTIVKRITVDVVYSFIRPIPSVQQPAEP